MKRLGLLLMLIWLSVLQPVMAETEPDHAAKIEAVKARLDALGPAEEGSSTQLRATYSDTLQRLQDQVQFTKQAAAAQALISDYPTRVKALEQSLRDYQAPPPSSFENLTLAQLEQAFAERTADLLNLETERNNLSSELSLVRNRRTAIPVELGQIKALQKALGDHVELDPGVGGGLRDAQTENAEAHLAALNAQQHMLELELLSSDNQAELIRLRTALVSKRIEAEKALIDQLRQQLQERRRIETEQTIAESRELAEVAQDSAPLLQEAVAENNRLSETLQQQTEAIERVISSTGQIEAESAKVGEDLKRIRQQLQWLKVSASFGETLRRALTSLPTPPNPEAMGDRLAETQLATYKMEQEAELLEDLPAYLNRLLEEEAADLNLGDREQMLDILKARRSLINQLLHIYNRQLVELAQLEVATQQLYDQIQQFRELIDEHLLWVPNTRPIYLGWLIQYQKSLLWLLNPTTWAEVPSALWQQRNWLPAQLMLTLVLLAGWLLSRRRLRYLNETYAKYLGKVSRDKFSYTLHLMMAGLFYALPFPLLCQSFGRLLTDARGLDFAQGVGLGLIWISWPLWFWLTLRHWGAPQGLLIQHLNWHAQSVHKWLRVLRRLAWFSLPLIMMINISESVNAEALRSSLGRGSFVVLCILLSLFYWRALRERRLMNPDKEFTRQLQRLYRMVWIALIVAPLGFAVLALYGYLYTGTKLLTMVQLSVLIAALGFIVYSLALRGLLVGERKIAFTRARARRAEMRAQRAREGEGGESAVELVEEEPVDLKTISDQTRGLVKSLLLFAFAVSLWLLWSQLFSALSFLDNITVWETALTLEGTVQMQPITLRALLVAIFVIILVSLSVRDLPGVMHLLILQHLDLSPGTGYAITTLLKYLLVLIGILVSCNILGFEWSKLQWLVAALGVGLGFGLQEIFANFISGLIILFEKPIRIGDTVTIKGLTGTVTKIQIRATTIVDWDRKEIIVPNKSFITEQLVNWSLSDPITRLIIRVGVAYGSDNRLVERLLLEAAGETDLVLKVPKPEAFFVGFGDSTLNYELRAFVSNMSDRFPATHALHNLIDAKFRAHGVEIAFPQMDVHWKRPPPPKPATDA